MIVALLAMKLLHCAVMAQLNHGYDLVEKRP
jgi:hypothetical protein